MQNCFFAFHKSKSNEPPQTDPKNRSPGSGQLPEKSVEVGAGLDEQRRMEGMRDCRDDGERREEEEEFLLSLRILWLSFYEHLTVNFVN